MSPLLCFLDRLSSDKPVLRRRLPQIHAAAAELDRAGLAGVVGAEDDLGMEAIIDEAALPLCGDDVRMPQDAEMMRHLDDLALQLGRDLADILLTAKEAAHDLQPIGIGDRFETLRAVLKILVA